MKTVHEIADSLYATGDTDAYVSMKSYIAERDRYIEHEMHGDYHDFIYNVCYLADGIIIAMQHHCATVPAHLDRLYYLAQGAHTIHRLGADDIVERAFTLYYALYEAHIRSLP